MCTETPIPCARQRCRIRLPVLQLWHGRWSGDAALELSAVDGSDPPVRGPGTGAGPSVFSHPRPPPFRGRSRSRYPLREGKRHGSPRGLGKRGRPSGVHGGAPGRAGVPPDVQGVPGYPSLVVRATFQSVRWLKHRQSNLACFHVRQDDLDLHFVGSSLRTLISNVYVAGQKYHIGTLRCRREGASIPSE